MFGHLSGDSVDSDEVPQTTPNEPFFKSPSTSPPQTTRDDRLTMYERTKERGQSFSSPDYVWTVYRKRWAILLAFFGLNFT